MDQMKFLLYFVAFFITVATHENRRTRLMNSIKISVKQNGKSTIYSQDLRDLIKEQKKLVECNEAARINLDLYILKSNKNDMQQFKALRDALRQQMEQLQTQLDTLNILINIAFIDDISNNDAYEFNTERHRLVDEMKEIKSLMKIVRESYIQGHCTVHPFKRDYVLTEMNNLKESLLELTKVALDPHPKTCAEAMTKTGQDGIYRLYIDRLIPPSFDALCANGEKKTEPWLYVMIRQDGSMNFNQDFNSYKYGFGPLKGEFFIGFEKLHVLTGSTPYDLRVNVVDEYDEAAVALYRNFSIDDEYNKYTLKSAKYVTGKAGDALSNMIGNKFSTYDEDNDMDDKSCATLANEPGFYKSCSLSANIFGGFMSNSSVHGHKGLSWTTFRDSNYRIKYMDLAIRPSK